MCISPQPPIHCNFPEQEFSSAEQQTDIWPDLLSFSNTFFLKIFRCFCLLFPLFCMFIFIIFPRQEFCSAAVAHCTTTVQPDLPLLFFSKTFASQFYAIACFVLSCHLCCPLDILICWTQHCTKTMQPDLPRLSFANASFKENNLPCSDFSKVFFRFPSIYTLCCFCSTVGVCCQCMIYTIFGFCAE